MPSSVHHFWRTSQSINQSMESNKHDDLILDAIDQLRKRKARPDLERICHMLERRHGLKSDEVSEGLADMVDRGIVMKVDYKGNTSYRNAAKWVRTKSLFKPDFSSTDMAIAVQEAVDAISQPGESESSTVRCASLHDIEKYLLKRETMCSMNIATLRSTLEREVNNGNIRQVRTGEYVSVNRTSIDNLSTDRSAYPPAVDGIDDSNESHEAKKDKLIACTNILKNTTGIKCHYCLLPAELTYKGEPEGLLVCKVCDTKAHPTCAEYSGETAKRIMLSVWQCPDCKVCSICSKGPDEDEDDVLICNECDKGFHMKCHNPPVTVKPIPFRNWTCTGCIRHNFWKGELNSSGTSTFIDIETVPDFSHVEISTEEATTFVFEKCLESYPEVVPAVNTWTIDQVSKFFEFIGLHEEAAAFKEQGIDGISLLMMKRDDVVIGLRLKLGLAVKLYTHVQRLQSVKIPPVPSVWSPD